MDEALTLGKMDVVIGEDEIVLDLDNLIPVGEDLGTEFSNQASKYAYVAMLAAQTESLYNGAKRGLERTKARIDKEVREKARLHDEKVTETVVFNRVLMSDEVEEAEDVESSYRYQYLMLRAVTSAMEMRAQMLISLGAHLRAESEQTGMLIKDTKAKLEEIKRSR